MSGFEKYLIENGFVMHKFDFKLGKNIPVKKHHISTMTNLDHRYIKDDKVLVFGLHEVGLPPTLISPRPFVYLIRHDGLFTTCDYSDNIMNRILADYTNDIILEHCYNNKPIGHYTDLHE